MLSVVSLLSIPVLQHAASPEEWSTTKPLKQYAGSFQTTGVHAAYGLHGSEPNPFTCYWGTVTTWRGTVQFLEDRAVARLDMETVATPTRSDHPEGVLCGSFVVGPHHVEYDLIPTGSALRSVTHTIGYTNEMEVRATVTEDGLAGEARIFTTGTDDHGGEFKHRHEGAIELSAVK
jgi:hypothetical protein